MARIQSDLDIMPPIEGLPEGLSKAKFTERYQRVDSPPYIAQVNEIRRRLANIPLYRD